MKNLNEACVYVNTYAKYNNGSLGGAWLTLSDYIDKDAFIEACVQLHTDEADPEFMFEDYDNIPPSLISASFISPVFWDLRDALEDLGEIELEAFFVFIDAFSPALLEESSPEIVANFRDSFIGAYDSMEDYAYELVDDMGDIPQWALPYFDYEAYARDLSCDYHFEDGFVFIN